MADNHCLIVRIIVLENGDTTSKLTKVVLHNYSYVSRCILREIQPLKNKAKERKLKIIKSSHHELHTLNVHMHLLPRHTFMRTTTMTSKYARRDLCGI